MQEQDIEQLLNDVELIEKCARENEAASTDKQPSVATVRIVKQAGKNEAVQVETRDSEPETVYIYENKPEVCDNEAETLHGTNLEQERDDKYVEAVIEQLCAETQAEVGLEQRMIQTEECDSDTRMLEARELNKRLIRKLEQFELESADLNREIETITGKYQKLLQSEEEEFDVVRETQRTELEELEGKKAEILALNQEMLEMKAQALRSGDERQEYEALILDGNKQLQEAQKLLEFEGSKIAGLEADKQALFQAIRQQVESADNFAQTDSAEVQVYQIAIQTDEHYYTVEASTEISVESRNKKVEACFQQIELQNAEQQTQTAFVCYECNELRGVVQNYKDQVAEAQEAISERENEVDELQQLVSELQELNVQALRKQRAVEAENASEAAQLDEFNAVMRTIDEELRGFKRELLARQEQVRALETERTSLLAANSELVARLERARAAFQ